MIKLIQALIDSQIREMATLNGDGSATIRLPWGPTINFICGSKATVIKALRKADPVTFGRLQDEIFDTLHPY